MLVSHWSLVLPCCEIREMICGIGSSIARPFLRVLAADRSELFVVNLAIRTCIKRLTSGPLGIKVGPRVCRPVRQIKRVALLPNCLDFSRKKEYFQEIMSGGPKTHQRLLPTVDPREDFGIGKLFGLAQGGENLTLDRSRQYKCHD